MCVWEPVSAAVLRVRPAAGPDPLRGGGRGQVRAVGLSSLPEPGLAFVGAPKVRWRWRCCLCFNGSMLPVTGAAPGQTGPAACSQPQRGHQLQLQLGALWLPQPQAALRGEAAPKNISRSWLL